MTHALFEMHDHEDPVLLPEASRDRWQPIRGGLLNLYLYDYEEFRYEHGHLILRGNNGTGKSRVMALQLPFLLDGRTVSSRVEPDADPSKRMEWNLLMGRHDDRMGYTWIEFGCVVSADEFRNDRNSDPRSRTSINGENGRVNQCEQVQQFVTLGCGLSATKGGGMRDPWFFVTDQRIGEDLYLQTEAGHPLSKSGLTEAIGSRGTVYSTAKDYRRAVDEKLFGLGPQRYEAMVDLLIQLRKPQLSRQLDEKMLARVLGEALPPPSEQMIADVAESFRGLEFDRLELNRFQAACEGVDAFLKIYRHYARIASRRRAAEVRQSQNKYETANREFRSAEREHTTAVEMLAQIVLDRHSLEIRIAECDTQIETLRADPKMRSANDIKRASDDEKQALIDLESAERDVRAIFDRLEQRQTAQTETFQLAESQLKNVSEVAQRTLTLAAACDLKTQHDMVFSGLKLQLGDSPVSSIGDQRLMRRQIDDICATRIQSSQQLKSRNQTLAEAERELATAKANRDDAQTNVENAIENQRSVEEKRHRAVHDFLESYRMWRRDSDELIVPSDDDIAEAVDGWSHRCEEASPIAHLLHHAELEARKVLEAEKVRLQYRVEALAIERLEAEQNIATCEEGFHEPPSLPIHVDEPERAGRNGAAFWSLVDFAELCPVAQRADIEAALESAGFLNAWVTTDGSILTADFSDVLLSIDEAPDVVAHENLSGVLIPEKRRDVGSNGISDGVINAILRKIGYGEQSFPTWIASDGQWRNGPMRGCCRKETVQFIGHDAREEQRIRRLESFRIDLQRIEELASQIQWQLRLVDDKSATITKQVYAAPSESPIRDAATQALMASQRTMQCRTALTEIEGQIAIFRTSVSDAREMRDTDARDLGLFSWIDRLDELDKNLSDYQRLLAEFWPSIDHFHTMKVRYGATVAAVKETEQDASLAEEKQLDQRTRHAKAKQRFQTLQETVGVEADEILRELAAAEERRRDLQVVIRQKRTDETEAERKRARIEERIDVRRDAIATSAELRKQSCDAFHRLCSMGLLSTATGAPHDDPAGWSISRTVDLARETESMFSQTSAEDTAWDRAQQSVTTKIQELNSALSRHAFTSTLNTVDGLFRVTVPYQGRDRTVHDLRKLLADEIEQRQLILDERERDIIENHLIGEVASKLHEQIHEAHMFVEKMNAEIQKRPMSTGMMLKFDWKPDEELSSGIVEMCKKLLGATGTWSPSERSAIGGFLQNHIREVRASREAGTWHEDLAEALDYRRWHRFWVMRKQDSLWKRLTKRTHGTGSGGEKAVALTIPQFAAAAAHYGSARANAPRLIVLDEAFVGIDPDMRGKCMELINVFDLDFLMTSENEWGCYAGLPGVAIYQLSTRSGFEAVFLTRWIWNGKQRLKDERPLPSAVRAES